MHVNPHFITSCDKFERIQRALTALSAIWNRSNLIFNNFGITFATTPSSSRTCEKLEWHEPINIPTSSVTSLIIIWRLYIIIFSAIYMLVQVGYVQEPYSAHFIFSVFLTIMEKIIPVKNPYFTQYWEWS